MPQIDHDNYRDHHLAGHPVHLHSFLSRSQTPGHRPKHLCVQSALPAVLLLFVRAHLNDGLPTDIPDQRFCAFLPHRAFLTDILLMVLQDPPIRCGPSELEQAILCCTKTDIVTAVSTCSCRKFRGINVATSTDLASSNSWNVRICSNTPDPV